MIGIDIGSTSVWVSADGIKSEEVPLVGGKWFEHLWRLIPPHSIVALEHTGVYSHPIINACLAVDGVEVWTVANAVTGHWRELFTSNKTDANDARALQHIAAAIGRGQEVRGVRRFTDVGVLRQLVNLRGGLVKDSGRMRRRCISIAAGVDPAFGAHLDEWAKLGFAVGHDLQLQLHDTALLKRVFDDGRGTGKGGGAHGSTINAVRRHFQHVSPTAQLTEVAARSLRWWYPRYFEAAEFLEQVEAELYQECKLINEPLYTAWMSLAGASIAYVAPLIVACRGSVLDFTAEEFRAVVGWRPERVDSGKSAFGRLPKTGYKPAKQAVYLWVFVLLKYTDHPVTIYFRSLEGKRSNRRTPTNGKWTRMLYGIGRRAELGKDWSEYDG